MFSDLDLLDVGCAEWAFTEKIFYQDIMRDAHGLETMR